MEINQYAVTASEMKDLSFLDIDQYVSAGVYQSQKVPVSLVKAYMLSENIEQILLADMQTLALAGDLVSLKTYLVDDGSTLYMVMAAGGVGNQIYQYAIDVTTGLFGTFDLVSGVFTALPTPTLQQVTDAGSTTSVGVTVDNGTESIDIKHDLIKINNALGTATITSPTLTTATEFRIPDKPTSPQTFAMLSDITGGGTVTSVGLSMPSAFSVASSPVTTSGTIAVTGAGVTSQYVRGDGSLANFPSIGGGGASLSYYLNGSVAQGTFGGVAMKEINKTPIIGAGTDFTIAANGYIQSFITDANDPNQLSIPAGNWNFETYFSASSSGSSPSFYVELYKWNGATLTLIASNSATPEAITGGTAIDLYLTAIAVPQTTLALTDRLAVRIYVNNSGRTITLHTEDNHLSQIITTFSTGISALNGLTEQVQTLEVGTTGTDFSIVSLSSIHKFLLPTASASARGALSSADWSAFNGKQATLTNPVTGTGTNNEIAAFNSTGSTITSLAVATYPSLTELSYAKGVTSAIQTQINAIKKPISSVGNGTAVTGVVVNTYSKGLLIPANSRVAGDVPQIDCQVTKTGTAGNLQLRFYWNTTNDLSGSPILIGTSANGAANWSAMSRLMCIEVAAGTGNGTKVAPTTVVLSTGWGTATAAPNSLAIDWTANGYLICAILNSSAADSSVCHMLKLL